MDHFIKLFRDKVASTIEVLTGVSPLLEVQNKQNLSIISNLSSSSVVAELSVNGNANARILLALPYDTSLYLSSFMDMSDSNIDYRKKVNKQRIKYLKKIISNIFDNISDFFISNSEELRLSFKVENILFIQNQISLDSFEQMITYRLCTGDLESSFSLVLDANFVTFIENFKSERDILKNSTLDKAFHVRVRIGSIDMSLDDVLKLNVGSIIELEENTVDEAFDILLDNKLFARGNIVIVDNEVGIEIKEKIESCKL